MPLEEIYQSGNYQSSSKNVKSGPGNLQRGPLKFVGIFTIVCRVSREYKAAIISLFAVCVNPIHMPEYDSAQRNPQLSMMCNVYEGRVAMP